MNDYSSVFQLISDLMRTQNTSCILIGGFAVNFYQVSRMTADIDFLITLEDFNKIREVLLKEGFKQLSSHENFAHFQRSELNSMSVDFMFVDHETYKKMETSAQKFKIGKNEFMVPSVHHLIALKLHSIKSNLKDRLAKDFPDIIGLIRNNQINIHDKEFKHLCHRHGSEEIYQRILEVLK